jgi:carbamoyl-phosphate synthase large subunit
MRLADDGTLAKFGVELIGAKRDAIDKAEDRLKFRDAMARIGLDCPRSRLVRNPAEAREAVEFVGLPAIIRPSFTLGGTGGGVAYNKDEYEEIVAGALRASPVGSTLVEESVLGWKEFEMEVVRDRADNCIIVCSIENVDPMGIHTGDSITVAPALTLTDKEYQLMRNASIACLREIGVDTGGSNVQFAVDPKSGRLVVIEMNPRVSRSSALASKATGFPIAKVAARLAVGYTLDELANDITGVTPASFEPTIDYVVVKMPRFTFEKFPRHAGAADHLDEVGRRGDGDRPHLPGERAEGAALARDRALRLRRRRDRGRGGRRQQGRDRAALAKPTPDRLLVIAQALRHGMALDEICAASKFDPWFVARIAEIVAAEAGVRAHGLPADAPGLRATQASRLLRRAARPARGHERGRRRRRAARAADSSRSSSASTPAPPSSPRARPISTRRTRAMGSAPPRARTRRPIGARW